MSKRNDSRRMCIVWIDHETDIDEWLLKIGAKRLFEGRIPVSERYELLPLIIKCTDSAEKDKEELAARAEQEIKRLAVEKEVDLVMVDLSYGADDHPARVEVGWGMALHLQEKFPSIGIGVYTRDLLSPHYRASISASGFGLVLEQFTNSIQRGGALTADNWSAVFDKVMARTKNRNAQFPSFDLVTGSHPQIEWMPGHPKSTSPSFKRYVPPLVARALAHLPDPKALKLTQLGGGFSGSYLVKAEPQAGQKHFVVKIDESPSRLKRELEGYSLVGAYLSQRNFIKPEGELVTLNDELWGAFALEYDGKRKPLVECEPLQAADFEKIYPAIWNECLFKVCGELKTNELKGDRILEGRKKASSVVAGWQRYLDRVQRGKMPAWSLVERGLEWLKAETKSDSGDPALQAPWAERVHGDLNCRNVFYAKDDPAILLIDFPNVKPGSLATDFVKAEVELVAVMMDRASGDDCELSRTGIWVKLTEALSNGLLPTFANDGDPELERVSKPIGIIRDLYSTKARSVGGDFQEAYRMTLIQKLMPYLGYPDITPAKKLLVLAWLGLLSTKRWQ